MALFVAMPSLLVPSLTKDTSQFVVILALLAGFFVFFEYYSRYPSILEFRFAAPYNRMKFIFAALSVYILSVIARGVADPSALTALLSGLGTSVGKALDFPYSPVHLVLSLLPSDTSAASVDAVRTATGVSYMASLIMLFTFVIIVRGFCWPVRRGAFNVCVNLPLFDPTGGGDVVRRLNRDASVNISLGFLMPFLLPAAALTVTDFADRFSVLNPQSMIWMSSAWAFLPASMIMRGIAMNRIAELITVKRRRAYAKAQDEDGLQTA